MADDQAGNSAPTDNDPADGVPDPTVGQVLRVLRDCANERERMGGIYNLPRAKFQAKALDVAHSMVLELIQVRDRQSKWGRR